MRDASQPLILRKVVDEGADHGHHGGAWKVAYADFVTAMMAFFLMLWLISTANQQTLKGLAEYFSEASENNGEPGGVGGLLDGISAISPDITLEMPSSPFTMETSLPLAERPDDPPLELDLSTAGNELEADLSDELFEAEKRRREEMQFEAARAAILNALEGSVDLKDFKSSLIMDQTEEGLRIQIVDRDQHAMFPVSSAIMYPHTERLIEVVAKAVADLEQQISIRGHTDSRPFSRAGTYDNWRLSSDRANATREALLAAGLAPERVAEVVGKADSEHLVPEDPNDARNRRISLVLLRERGEEGAQPSEIEVGGGRSTLEPQGH